MGDPARECLGARGGGGPELGAERRVASQLHEGLGERRGVARRHQPSRLAVRDDGRNAADLAADDGQAERHALHERAAHAFVARGRGEHVGGGQTHRDVRRHAGEPQAVAHAEPAGLRLEGHALRAIADEQDARRRHGGGQRRQGGDEDVEAFDRDESPEPHDDERIVGQSQSRPRDAACRRGGTQLRGRHAARDRAVLRALADASREMLVDPALGERHDAIRPARGQALERDVERGASRAVVAVKDMAVRLMDHDRHAREARRQPSDEAGLGGVGVHDRRLLRAHEAPEPHERRGVARPDFAAESRDVVQRRPAPARVVHAGGIGRRDADSQRAGIARRLEREHRGQRVLGRAAERQSRDDVQRAEAHRGRRLA